MTHPITWTTADDRRGGTTREFQLTRDGQRKVTGALWLPPQPRDDTPLATPLATPLVPPLVLCGHGASGDRYQAPIPTLARRFTHEAGCAVLSLDGPVHGLRQVGAGGRDAFFPEIQRPGSIDDMVADWTAAIDAACALPELAPVAKPAGHPGAKTSANTSANAGTNPKLAYFGLSMGSIYGIPLLAHLASRPDRAVTVATVGLLGSQGAVQHLGQRLLADAARITCPLLCLMQLEDELFNREGCLALFDALASPDKRLHANPGLHPAVPQEEIDFCFAFMRDRLMGDAPRRMVDLISD